MFFDAWVQRGHWWLGGPQRTVMHGMFNGASSFNQDLGWCVDDGVSLDSKLALRVRPSRARHRAAVTQGGCAGWFGSSSQTSNDGVADDDKMMTLVVLAGLLGLSLAIAAGLFALRQQQAAKKPRAPPHVYGHGRPERPAGAAPIR